MGLGLSPPMGSRLGTQAGIFSTGFTTAQSLAVSSAGAKLGVPELAGALGPQLQASWPDVLKPFSLLPRAVVSASGLLWAQHT